MLYYHLPPLRGCRPRFSWKIDAACFVFADKVYITGICGFGLLWQNQFLRIIEQQASNYAEPLLDTFSASGCPNRMSTSTKVIHINHLIHTHQLIHIKYRIHTLKIVHKALIINSFCVYLRFVSHCKSSFLT